MQTEQNLDLQHLSSLMQEADKTWQAFPPCKIAAYAHLMENEEYWNSATHSRFSKVTYWHPLGAA
jgi:hypothetical protein